MHLLCFLSLACSLLAAALIPSPREAPATVAAFESGLGFSEAEPDGGEVKAFEGKDLEEQLRSVSSVDELMSVLYPDYWNVQVPAAERRLAAAHPQYQDRGQCKICCCTL